MRRRAAFLICAGGLVCAASCGSFDGGSAPAVDSGVDVEAPSVEAGPDSAEAGCGDVQSSSTNCGACGHSCLGDACVAGRCAPTVFLTANHPKCIVLDDDWAYWLEESSVGARARWANKKDKSTAFYDSTTVVVRDCAIAGDAFYTAKIAAGRGIEAAPKRVMSVYASTRNVAPIAIAVVASGGRYWLDDDGALKGCAAGDCTGIPDLPAVPPPTVLASAPSGQAIATDGLFVFWTSDDGTVRSIDREVDAGSPTQLASGQQKPRGIAVDGTHVYWATQLGGTIVKVPKGGGTPMVLATGVDRPRAIAIDATHVYWASDLAGTIGRVSKSGGPAEILADGQSSPLRVAVDDKHVYWINDLAEAEAGATGAVMRVAK